MFNSLRILLVWHHIEKKNLLSTAKTVGLEPLKLFL